MGRAPHETDRREPGIPEDPVAPKALGRPSQSRGPACLNAPLWLGLVVAVVSSISGSEGRGTPPVSSESASNAVPARDRPDFEKELAFAYSASAPAKSGSRAFHLRAAVTSVQQFDGRMLAVWAYNDRVPGPILRTRLGEEVEVDLENDLPQPTTIH